MKKNAETLMCFKKIAETLDAGGSHPRRLYNVLSGLGFTLFSETKPRRGDIKKPWV
jgi:hypothetical protein